MTGTTRRASQPQATSIWAAAFGTCCCVDSLRELNHGSPIHNGWQPCLFVSKICLFVTGVGAAGCALIANHVATHPRKYGAAVPCRKAGDYRWVDPFARQHSPWKLFFVHFGAGRLSSRGQASTRRSPAPSMIPPLMQPSLQVPICPQGHAFLSAAAGEMDAERVARMQTALAIRPGNRETKGVQHLFFHPLHDITIVRP